MLMRYQAALLPAQSIDYRDRAQALQRALLQISVCLSIGGAAMPRASKVQVSPRDARHPTGVSLAALVLGAFAVGALAIGFLAINRLAVERARIRRLEIDELILGRVHRIAPSDDRSGMPEKG
jgi:hypothetical protein